MIYKKVIITGGTGAPGQALVRKLIKENVQITLITRENSGRAKYLPKSDLIDIVYTDLNEIDKLELKSKDYDVIFHLGWSYTDPVKRIDPYYQIKNIDMTLKTVEFAAKHGCKKFVGCGSQAEFGRKSCRLNSSVICNPEIAYGAAKLAASHLSRVACEKYGIDYNWVRVLSVFGPVDNPYNVISSTILGILRNEPIKLTKGEQIWDLLYTEDLADAFWAVANKGISGKTYIVGCGEELSLREQLKVFVDELCPTYEIEWGGIPYSNNQIMYLCADNSEITEDTGWEPHTRMKEAAKKTVGFWKTLYSYYGSDIYIEYFKGGPQVDW